MSTAGLSRPVAASFALAALLFAASEAHAAPGAPDPLDSELLASCGRGDVALGAVAASFASSRLAGEALPEGAELASALRDAGSDAPWPRWWSTTGGPVDRGVVAGRLRAWSRSLPGPGPRRCGVGSARDERGREALVVIAAPDAARLSFDPPAPAPGQWVEVRATPTAPTTWSRLVVLGPRGLPFSPPTWTRDGILVARFAVDHEGEWAVQALADLGRGPVPVAEARLSIGAAPAARAVAAPGEREGEAGAAGALGMLDAARTSERLAPLARSPELSRVAEGHARRLAAGTTPEHDTGEGDASERVLATGVVASQVGEIVAHAPSLALAHRALWRSPSHRAAMLSRHFDRVGAGLCPGRGGSVWLVEVLAAR